MTLGQIKALVAYAKSPDHVLLVKLRPGTYQVVKRIVPDGKSHIVTVVGGCLIERELEDFQWDDFLVGTLPQTLEPVEDVELSVDLDDYPLF